MNLPTALLLTLAAIVFIPTGLAFLLVAFWSHANRCPESPTGYHVWDASPTVASGWRVIRCQHCKESDIA